MLPSPIPHPLDYCPWDVPGWIYEALDWVVGVEWPDGNERAVWDLADQWYAVAEILAGPRTDATDAAGEIRSGYGGVGLVAEAFDIAWHRVAEGAEAPLPVLLAVTGELGKLVESCGCDIEGAKLEAWIELGILVVELLSLAVATVLTLGAASPAAGAAITASRIVVQQIFKRLVAQLARKALKEGLKEASERAAKEVVKSGTRGLAHRAAIGGLVEAGQEAGTSLATQAYQNSTGRRDGLDLTDVGMSGLGGFAGGAVAPLAGLGRHAHGGFAQVGERFGREMAGETLAEGAAGLAIGQGVSLEDLARSAVSGVSGSATSQAETAMHHRLDGKLTGLSAPPVDLAVPLPTGESGHIPAQRMPDPVGPLTGPLGSTAAGSAAQPDVHHPGGTDTPGATPDPTRLAQAVPAAERLSSPVHLEQPSAGVAALATDSAARPSHVPATPTLSSVAVEAPVVATHPVIAEPRPAPMPAITSTDLTTSNQPAPVQASTAPTVVSGPSSSMPQPNGASPTAADRLAGGSPQAGALTAPPAHHTARPPVDPAAGPAVTGPDNRPTPNPRFPLLETLAPAPGPARDPSPALPGPFDPLPPRRPTPEELAARRAAEREALDRRRYQAYLQDQRQWYEENRRQQRAAWLREQADYHDERASDWAAQATELRRAGRKLAAQRWYREARESSNEANVLRDEAQMVLAGSLAPDAVLIEDDADFYRINDDVADLAPGAVETSDTSALTGDGHPLPIDRSRRYGMRGGLRPPLALHQTDLERQMPRNPDGSVVRTADPRYGGWFKLANDGGPQADATRSINCLDCTLSLYDTWLHGRPRVSAPRTFDGYLMGDVRSPIGGEEDGPLRVEEVTGGRFQKLCVDEPPTDLGVRQMVETGYRDLHEQLLAGGHGSYAFVITSWQGGGSHAWVALNQNGTVLYLDPQWGSVWDRPLYTHSGVSQETNVVGIDALVVGPDGRPMPLAGRPPGDFNRLPDPLERPDPPRPSDPPAPYDGGDDPPDFNHVHLLGESTTFHRADGPSSPGSAPAPGADDVRRAHLNAHTERISAGLFVRDAITASTNLDQVFAAGVTPVELVHHLDAPTLRRLAPELDDAAARDVARLLADPRVQRMLDQTWEAPPRGEPLLAETLLRQLAQRPELVRMILATPELANSLTARPLTLHHLASHQEAIDVLGEVVNDLAQHGPDALIAVDEPIPRPTPVTDEQRQLSGEVAARRQDTWQLGFDRARQEDEGYRLAYVEKLYVEAAVAQPELNDIASTVAGNRGRPDWRSRPKDRERVLDKLVEYENDVSRLKDLAAAKVEFDQLDDIYRALSRLAVDPRVVMLDIKDRFLSPQGSGYRDILLNLRLSNGHVAELRLQLAPVEHVAEWEHALYEVRRDLDALTESDGRPLTKVERAIRDGLLVRVQDIYWRAIEGFREVPQQ
ncbi:toxin glutamine deamidase domain-containing protein [Micromonospora sp. NPDC007230]|uniref:toxin glutamine deamidase domain-containing protein n=1 Tax=Micromonospora sp. NPDC007230 TaxID=3364237 RepID=UPI00368D54E7